MNISYYMLSSKVTSVDIDALIDSYDIGNVFKNSNRFNILKNVVIGEKYTHVTSGFISLLMTMNSLELINSKRVSILSYFLNSINDSSKVAKYIVEHSEDNVSYMDANYRMRLIKPITEQSFIESIKASSDEAKAILLIAGL